MVLSVAVSVSQKGEEATQSKQPSPIQVVAKRSRELSACVRKPPANATLHPDTHSYSHTAKEQTLPQNLTAPSSILHPTFRSPRTCRLVLLLLLINRNDTPSIIVNPCLVFTVPVVHSLSHLSPTPPSFTASDRYRTVLLE